MAFGPARAGWRGHRVRARRSLGTPASARTGPVRFPRPLLTAPSRRLPNTELPGQALISRKETATPTMGCPANKQQVLLGRSSRRRLPHSPHFPAAPRLGTATPRVTARAGERLRPPRGSLRGGRAGRCRPVGDFAASPAPFPAREGAATAPPPALAPTPPPGAAEANGSQWARRRLAGWRLSPSRGRERGEGSARAAAAPRAVGEEPREEEEEPRSSSPRTTACPGCGGLTPAPRLPPCVPDRQHDRRAAPGLLLHRAEG